MIHPEKPASHIQVARRRIHVNDGWHKVMGVILASTSSRCRHKDPTNFQIDSTSPETPGTETTARKSPVCRIALWAPLMKDLSHRTNFLTVVGKINTLDNRPPAARKCDDLLDYLVEYIASLTFWEEALHNKSLADPAVTEFCQKYLFRTSLEIYANPDRGLQKAEISRFG